ncbi:uncharacterized protein AB675_3024 [Cyphellophora attinorum]|uniref:Gamma tubulin complex component C-terminal domain-containing protein n=1 Tax=Cyphellophora attinorum TaxID=1664694 RepID=A0A0N1H1E2_9EURO|nr:uncharacterized protein AB675_3024 [Phialophora attinorum]KPI37897.1 hypothetical protein AB675_3024 [Phialophora attinorum]
MQRPPESNPFTTAGLIALPPLNTQPADEWDGFTFTENLESGTFYLPDTKSEALPLLQPETFKLSAVDAELESLDPPSSSSSAYDTAEDVSPAAGADPAPESDNEDIWILPDVKNAPRTLKLTSWDHFHNESYREPAYHYISEAGPQVLDAILASEGQDEQYKTAPPDAYLDALFELALGRSSQYVRWDEKHQEFVPTVQRLTISGYSPELIEDLRYSLDVTGRTMRIASSLDVHDGRTTPGQIAFYSAARAILAAVQGYLQQERADVRTPVQLAELIEGPHRFVVCVGTLLNTVACSGDDAAILRDVLQSVPSMVSLLPRYRGLFTILLSAIAGSVLARLRSDLETPPTIDAEEVHENLAVSKLLSEELSQLIGEIRTSKALVSAAAAGVAQSDGSALPRNIELGLKYSWQELAKFQEQVNFAEDQLSVTEDLPERKVDATAPDAAEEGAFMTFQPIDFGSLTHLSFYEAQAALQEKVFQCLTEESSNVTTIDSVPFDQVVELSLAPFITAEHHKSLPTNLAQLQDFQLLGNGPFATRISIALFDTSQASGEGRRRDGNSTGLRLATRDTWPPTSSELRMVLMGILREHLPEINGRQQFEDIISFSLRDLPEEALEKCRDINSIYALDFLRMQYRSPTALLAAVITPRVLEKYDRIFQHLLRLMRVQHLAQHLLREVSSRAPTQVSAPEHRLRHRIQHAISTLADYTHNTALRHGWLAFEQVMAAVQTRIDAGDYHGTLQTGRSLAHLRDALEAMLDDMLRALLLKERQSKSRRCIEELFGVVLRFAASRRHDHQTTSNNDEAAAPLKQFSDGFRDCLDRIKEGLEKEEGLPQHLLLRLTAPATLAPIVQLPTAPNGPKTYFSQVNPTSWTPKPGYTPSSTAKGSASVPTSVVHITVTDTAQVTVSVPAPSTTSRTPSTSSTSSSPSESTEAATTVSSTAASSGNTGTSGSATASPTPAPVPSPGGLSTGAKAGIGAGVGAGVLASIIVLALICLRRRRRNRNPNLQNPPMSTTAPSAMKYTYSPAPTDPPRSDGEVPPRYAQPSELDAANGRAGTESQQYLAASAAAHAGRDSNRWSNNTSNTVSSASWGSSPRMGSPLPTTTESGSEARNVGGRQYPGVHELG